MKAGCGIVEGVVKCGRWKGEERERKVKERERKETKRECQGMVWDCVGGGGDVVGGERGKKVV